MDGYDIIGDVHGCATQLEELLDTLGYRRTGGSAAFRHPHRQAIFVGDLIDRGPEQLRTLEIARAMVDAGSARIVLGNHEFNALAYHTEWPPGSGRFLRPRSERNTRQHAAFLEQVTGPDRQRYLQWFTTIPLWLDLGGLRVVHACWHEESITTVRTHCGTSAPFGRVEHLVAAATAGHRLHGAIETLLKGPEIALTEYGGRPYHDKDGNVRTSARLRWWDGAGSTLRDLAEVGGGFTTVTGEPYPPLADTVVPQHVRSYTYRGTVPVFYGHYWRRDRPEHGHDWTRYTACVDFSAVAGGRLTAYRWSGETTVDPSHYVAVS